MLQRETAPQAKRVSGGNQSAKSLPSHTIVHAKLEMTEPGDHDEREADAMANTIMSGGKIARKISSGGSGSSGIAVSQQMESQLNHLQGGGRQMPEGLRNMMESGFGQDFSQVRLHTDSEAASMSSSIHAKAFTLGNDIYFNRGQFSPQTSEGRRLVAHELTHVVQGSGKVGRWENPQIRYEKDLDKALDGKYSAVLKRLLSFYGFQSLDEYRQSAVVKAYFYAIEHDKWYTTIKGLFIEYLKNNYRYEISEKTIDKIADTFNDNKLFEDDYKKAIRVAYDRALRDRITQYHDQDTQTYQHNDDKWMAAASRLRREALNKAAKTAGSNDTNSQLDRIEGFIASHHYDKMVDPSSFYTNPENLVSGKTWTSIFLATMAAEAALVSGPLVAACAGLFGGGTLATIISTCVVNGVISGFSTAASEINEYHYANPEDRKSEGQIVLKCICSGVASAVTAGLSKYVPLKNEYISDVVYSVAGDALSGLIDQVDSGAYYSNGEFKTAEFVQTAIKTVAHAVLAAVLKKLTNASIDRSGLKGEELKKFNELVDEISGSVDISGAYNVGIDAVIDVGAAIAE